MSMIVCDKCKFEWLAKDTVFHEQMLDESSGTKMRYFQCPECGHEYVVDVTDSELRQQISILKKMKRKYVHLYNKQSSKVVLRNYGEKLERVQAEIIERQKSLKEKWIRGEQ